MSARENIHDIARGRWRSILPQLGIHESNLTGKHGPCPLCGGKDRFRWDNKAGGGGYICGQCGSGTGLDLVMKSNGIDFKEARTRVLQLVGSAPVEAPKANRGNDFGGKLAERVWNDGISLNGMDPASKYLSLRGLRSTRYPASLRFVRRAFVKLDDGRTTHLPALAAKFTAPDGEAFVVQNLFLDDAGRKSPLVPKPRQFTPGTIPQGGAVRLGYAAETMGVAEGVETAMSAAKLHDVPVWATLTAGLLSKWEAPQGVKHVIVFSDADANYQGQAAAFALAHRLVIKGLNVEVRIPPELDTDWNDLLMMEAA